MENRNDRIEIAKVVKLWFQSLMKEDEAQLKSIVTPYGFRDKEVVYKNGKLINQEDIQYTHAEYIRHVRLLWNKREYLQTKIEEETTYLFKMFAIHNVNFRAKIKNKNKDSIIKYNDMEASFELLRLDKQWYLSGLKNIIRIED
ncbi:hypothetical protein [Sporohalobacter salinus]|uniref:hypothetical protein n=1 Tax=Sporohalobacter salinus TaxID=1494606 RepID=UPI00195FF9CA|nr:hypothetical protein [Sporohalobacter salinus]MBM7623130.1 hypothetical protein [Sporohalobacter salinus]